MSCLVHIVLSCLDLLLLLLSGLFPGDALFGLFVGLLFFFSPKHVSAFFLCLIILLSAVDFKSAFPVDSPIQVLSFFRGTLILSQTNFAPFNSLIFSCVKIHLYFQPVFQSFFLCIANLIFFSAIIIFNFSIIISSSCHRVNSLWFGGVLFYSLLLCNSFRLDCSCCSVFGVSIIVGGLLASFPTFFWCICNILRAKISFQNSGEVQV